MFRKTENLEKTIYHNFSQFKCLGRYVCMYLYLSGRFIVIYVYEVK